MRTCCCNTCCPAPCPPCQCPEFPSVVCTPAFDSFSEQLLQIPSSAVTIPNAFNSNDGPAPYTVLTAAFMNLQLPMQGLMFAPLSGNSYSLLSNITPMVLVTYLDGSGVQRAKILQAPLQLAGIVTSSVDPNTLIWWAFMENGSITNTVLSGTTLSFTASAGISVISLSSFPSHYPVLQDLPLQRVPSGQAQSRDIYPMASYCRLSNLIIGSSMIAIPFVSMGPAPYSDPTAVSVGGQPYVLRVEPQSANVTLLDLAFPILLSFTDSNGQLQTQSTFLYMTLLSAGIAGAPNTRIIADLEISGIVPSANVTPPALTLESLVLTGSIAAIEGRARVQTISTVQCGEMAVASCQLILPPPTAEITG